MAIYSVAAMLSKSTESGRVMRLCNGYRTSEDDEDTVLGRYMVYLQKENPEYSIDDALILHVEGT